MERVEIQYDNATGAIHAIVSITISAESDARLRTKGRNMVFVKPGSSILLIDDEAIKKEIHNLKKEYRKKNMSLPLDMMTVDMESKTLKIRLPPGA